jgi:hypothetical protein
LESLEATAKDSLMREQDSALRKVATLESSLERWKGLWWVSTRESLETMEGWELGEMKGRELGEEEGKKARFCQLELVDQRRVSSGT